MAWVISYKSKNWIVRSRRKRGGEGKVGWILARPDTPNDALMEYADKEHAIFIAHYTDEHYDGAFGSQFRHEAEAAWIKAWTNGPA